MSIMTVVKIGQSLKRERVNRFMNQERFAKLIGISARQLVRLESNKAEPHFSTITKIAERLGVEPADLLDD
jgi:transcriptional regulator with XRE-family HTH domain